MVIKLLIHVWMSSIHLNLLPTMEKKDHMATFEVDAINGGDYFKIFSPCGTICLRFMQSTVAADRARNSLNGLQTKMCNEKQCRDNE